MKLDYIISISESLAFIPVINSNMRESDSWASNIETIDNNGISLLFNFNVDYKIWIKFFLIDKSTTNYFFF